MSEGLKAVFIWVLAIKQVLWLIFSKVETHPLANQSSVAFASYSLLLSPAEHEPILFWPFSPLKFERFPHV